jgi:hypothetical protein
MSSPIVAMELMKTAGEFNAALNIISTI